MGCCSRKSSSIIQCHAGITAIPNLTLMIMLASCASHPSSLLPPLQATGSSSGGSTGGAGGAIFIGMWGSRLLLHNSSFANNSARQQGGALHAMAIDSSLVSLQSVNATNNSAMLLQPGLAWASEEEVFAGPALVAVALRSDGGALHVAGSEAALVVADSRLQGNTAGRVSDRDWRERPGDQWEWVPVCSSCTPCFKHQSCNILCPCLLTYSDDV